MVFGIAISYTGKCIGGYKMYSSAQIGALAHTR